MSATAVRPAAGAAARRHDHLLGARLAVFAALSAYAVGHWGGLVQAAPAWRLAAVAAIATAAGALTASTRGVPGLHGVLARVIVGVGALAAATAVVGLEVRLLLPGNWGELREGLDQGFAGLRSVQWPYGGGDEWVRLTLLLGAPALLVPAAVLAFWPARRVGSLAGAAALVLLLVAYGVPATEREFGAELLRGAGLAVLVVVWLWAPRARAREATAALAAVALATLAAVPAAAALDGDEPWFDYRAWNWFGTVEGTTFDWNHSYGPIDWPRDGTTLLRARAERPLYWKVEVQDRFDGFRWVRSGAGAGTPPSAELPRELDPAWLETAEFTIRELRSELVVVTGTPLGVRGVGPASVSADGTTRRRDGQLREGHSYEVTAYVPNPSRRRLRSVSESWSPYFRRYLRVDLPPAGVPDPQRGGPRGRRPVAPAATVALPLRGRPHGPEAAATERLIRESPYARTYELARRLTAGAPSAYDAVKAVETHLLENFTYSEQPPERDVPLDAFLFEDRLGYCQQFSGAMALMLRLAGIPARVVGGFAPGSFNRDQDDFRVRDLDAHSWVEVYFPRIGWVQFDPTPSGTPAESRAEPDVSPTSATGTTDPGGGEALAAQSRRDSEAARSPAREDGGPGAWALLALALGVAGLGAGAAWAAAAAARRRHAGDPEAPLRELARALGRLGYPLPAGTTLLALEERLGRVAGPRSAAYVRALRAVRFAGGAAPPGPGDRRALRAELGRGGGRLGRLRSWVALPPFSRS